jgi:glutamate dehydrogenase (NADP+)
MEDAKQLASNKVSLVAEGANMPTVPDGIKLFQDEGTLFAPGKAANAGGVATSGLEMSQNAGHTSWDRNTVDRKLRDIMVDIHANCHQAAEAHGTPGNYVNGANIAGFLKVANAMLAQGVV